MLNVHSFFFDQLRVRIRIMTKHGLNPDYGTSRDLTRMISESVIDLKIGILEIAQIFYGFKDDTDLISKTDHTTQYLHCSSANPKIIYKSALFLIH